MYVTIKYKYENMMNPELEKIVNDAVREITSKLPGGENIEDNVFVESCLRFDDKDEMDKHIEVMVDFLKRCQECIVTDIEVEDVPAQEYIDKLGFQLKHIICRKYAKSIGMEFKTIRDENIHCRDKDFVSKAYEYIIDELKEPNPYEELLKELVDASEA